MLQEPEDPDGSIQIMNLKELIENDLIQIEEVTCGNACGHFDYLNQCCWVSWGYREEGDYCNCGLVEIEGIIYTQIEMKALLND